MYPETRAMCRRFAELAIAHWRQSIGLPRNRARNRRDALRWIALAKGKNHASPRG